MPHCLVSWLGELSLSQGFLVDWLPVVPSGGLPQRWAPARWAA